MLLNCNVVRLTIKNFTKLNLKKKKTTKLLLL